MCFKIRTAASVVYDLKIDSKVKNDIYSRLFKALF